MAQDKRKGLKWGEDGVDQCWGRGKGRLLAALSVEVGLTKLGAAREHKGRKGREMKKQPQQIPLNM